MYACLRTLHRFNVLLEISVALVPCILAAMPSNNVLKVKANWPCPQTAWPCPQTAQIRGLVFYSCCRCSWVRTPNLSREIFQCLYGVSDSIYVSK